MSTYRLALGAIIISTFISIVYLIVALARRDKKQILSGVVMLLCPVAGSFFIFFSWLLNKTILRKNSMDLEDITFSKEQKDLLQRPNYEEEINTVPLEEAFIASNDDDRRQALLNKLKKNYDQNLATIKLGVENEDVETAHYAASVILNMNNTFMANLKEFALRKEREPDDYQTNREYADYVLEYIESSLLSDLENEKYVFMYLELMKELYEIKPEALSTVDFRNMVDFYLEYNSRYEAEKWCGVCMDMYPGEEISYLNYLKLYYTMQMTKEFLDMLNRLKSSSVFLSEKGLNLMRFFNSGIHSVRD